MPLTDWFLAIRWIHVLAASAWLGEVVVINAVLIPTIPRLGPDVRRRFVATVFPRLFRMASVLSATTVLTGTVLLYRSTQGQWSMLTTGRWGRFILFGGTLGLGLTVFHFFLEDRLTRRVGIGHADLPDDALADVHHQLRIVPRVGLVVIVVAYCSMMYAVRGL